MEYTKSYSKSKSFLTGAIAISAVMFMYVSCSGKSDHRHPGIADDPAGTYRHYLSEVRKLDKLSTEELADHINCWQTVRDSVFSLAVRDTSSNPHSSLYSECEELHDSLRMEFCRMARSNGRTYLDVFVLKEQTSPYIGDRDLKAAADNARPFFISLDSIPPLAVDGNGILSAYRRLLARTLQNGIHDLTDLKTFIKDEDVVFRSFLTSLNSLAGENLSDITKDTEQCCSQVYIAAENKEISYRDAMIYMAMRTNRRLIQNAAACLNDVLKGKVENKSQAWGYACMVLQPYISMDGICMVLLSDSDKKKLRRIAEQTPAAFDGVGDIQQSDKEHLDELPVTLMEIYIRNL